MRVIIGDVHGCYKTLKSLLENRLSFGTTDEIYIVGDLIDRGPGSKQVIDYILNLREAGYRVNTVRGNHEEMFLETFRDQTENNYMLWLMNGAETTFRSYGIESYKFERVAAINHIPENHISYLRSLPYYLELEDCFIVHAGLDFQNKDTFHDFSTMVWSRGISYTKEELQGKLIVHGHTPIPAAAVEEYFIQSDRCEVNVDTGCVYSELHPGMGYLTAFDLDTFQFYSEENLDF